MELQATPGCGNTLGHRNRAGICLSCMADANNTAAHHRAARQSCPQPPPPTVSQEQVHDYLITRSVEEVQQLIAQLNLGQPGQAQSVDPPAAAPALTTAPHHQPAVVHRYSQSQVGFILTCLCKYALAPLFSFNYVRATTVWHLLGSLFDRLYNFHHVHQQGAVGPSTSSTRLDHVTANLGLIFSGVSCRFVTTAKTNTMA